MLFQGLADAIRQGGIHQQTHRHHHQQGHDPLRFFEIERRGQKAWIFAKPKATFGILLAFIALEHLLGGELAVVELVGGEDKTTLRGHECLTGSNRRCQGAFDLVYQLVGLSALARPAPRVIAGPATNSHRRQRCGVPAVRKGGQRLRGIGVTRKRCAAEFLEGFEVVGTLYESVLVHGTLRLGAPMLGVNEHPALRDTTVGRLQDVRAIAFYQWGHCFGVSLGQGRSRGGHSGWDPGNPLAAGIG
jgi:hypothetical protein